MVPELSENMLYGLGIYRATNKKIIASRLNSDRAYQNTN